MTFLTIFTELFLKVQNLSKFQLSAEQITSFQKEIPCTLQLLLVQTHSFLEISSFKCQFSLRLCLFDSFIFICPYCLFRILIAFLRFIIHFNSNLVCVYVCVLCSVCAQLFLKSLGISNKNRGEKYIFKTWYMVQQIKWNKE